MVSSCPGCCGSLCLLPLRVYFPPLFFFCGHPQKCIGELISFLLHETYKILRDPQRKCHSRRRVCVKALLPQLEDGVKRILDLLRLLEKLFGRQVLATVQFQNQRLGKGTREIWDCVARDLIKKFEKDAVGKLTNTEEGSLDPKVFEVLLERSVILRRLQLGKLVLVAENCRKECQEDQRYPWKKNRGREFQSRTILSQGSSGGPRSPDPAS